MPSIHRNALVPYTAAQMYNLVDGIENYPVFLPWCRSTTVHARDEDAVRASIEIAWGSLRRTFTTLNHLQPNKMIEVRLVEGPFRHLEGFWRFDALGEVLEGGVSPSACKVSLDLEFEFANMLASLAVGPVFSQIGNSLVDAFCKRARQVYGER